MPNGNTLIDEGSDGRVIEVTPEKEIVWEWISPYYTHNETGPKTNMIYRAYRYPYDYVPQEPKPQETAIAPVDNATYRLPGAGKFGAKVVIDVEGTLPYYNDVALCVATDDEEDLAAREKVFSVDTALFQPVTTTLFATPTEACDKPTLVLFGAERCVHCKALHPVLEEALASEFKDCFTVRFVDIDTHEALKTQYHITGIPVVAVFSDGKERGRFSGERDYDDICDFLESFVKR